MTEPARRRPSDRADAGAAAGTVVLVLVVVWVLLFTVGLPLLIGAIQRATEKRYDFPLVTIDVTVRPDGDLVLTERRTVSFHNGPFSYAYFDVAEPAEEVRDFSVTQVTPTGETPLDASASPWGDFHATWTYPEAEDETRTFVFRYRVACGVDVYQDTAHLLWQFVGTGWAAPTERAEITLHLPGHAPDPGTVRPEACDPAHAEPAALSGVAPLGPGEIAAWGHGPLNGEVAILDPQTVRFLAQDVPAHTFVEGSVLFPADAVPAGPMIRADAREAIATQEATLAAQANAIRTRHRLEAAAAWWLLLAVPAAMALLVVLAWWRDRVPGVPETLDEPPEDDSVVAALLWSAWRGHLSTRNAYRAQLLRLARLGAIRLRAVGRVTEPEDVVAERGEVAELERDRRFVDMLFATAGDDGSVSLTHPSRGVGSGSAGAPARYAAWWKNAMARAGDPLDRIRTGDARVESVLAFAIGLGAIGAGIWLGAVRHAGAHSYLVLPVALASMILVLRAIPARVAPELRERVQRLAAFRRYLRRFSDLPNAPAMAVVIWDRYLEFATALDVADEVEKQVTALVPVEELRAPWPGGPSGAAGLSTWHTVDARAASVLLSASTAVSSGSSGSGTSFGSMSSSSGFGGGFSSGGGGGGGGTGGGFG